MKKILTIGRYFRSRFGARVRKIPISLPGFTCPNIDGFKARGGCIYCNNESFSPSLATISKAAPIKMNFTIKQNPILDRQLAALEKQFIWHSEFHKNKFGISKYFIYFQSYTNTYAPLDTLNALYSRALTLPNVVGMSIGTRSDCVSSELLELLGEMAKRKEIWIEYGIQSVYEDTLKLINRGHGMEGVEELFARTRAHGIKVCAHLIYGLPNESMQMMKHTLKKVLEWGIDGIKLHPMYVVCNTKLANMHKRGEYTPITLEEFGDMIVYSLKEMPEDVVVQRISAGAHNEQLIAPLWCFDKNIQMRYLRDRLKENGIIY